jgi:hypothetical protein
MTSKHFLLAVIFIFLCLTFYGCLYVTGKSGYRGDIYDSWETANNTFKVKITAYEEVGTFMPGAYFYCATASVGSDSWRYFKTYRTDDAVSIPHYRFRFVNDQIAYFYGSEEFLVTTNAGKDWAVWTPLLSQPNDKKIFYWGIKDVSIEADGMGKANLERFDLQSNANVSIEAFTKDYGQSWKTVE